MPPIRSRRASMVRRRSIKRTPMASTPKKIDNNDIKEPKDVIIAGQPKKDNNNNIKQETSIEEKKESGGLLLLKNNEAKSTSDAGTMTPTTGSAGQPQAPAASDSSKIEVYNIQIQQDFKKLAVLPPITVWSRAVDKNTFRTGVLRVCIKRKALLFDRRLASGCFPCVLTGQGHLIVYSELTDEGYAVNLCKAPKLCIKFAKPLFNESPVERICKLTARWLFGSVHLKFPDRSRKTIDWCTAILEAISDHPKAQLRIGDKPGTTTPEEHPQEQCVPVLRLLKTVEETAEKTTNEQKEEEGTVEQQEQKVTATGAVNTAGPAASSHSDAPDSMATDSDSNSLDELGEEEDNEGTLAEPDAVEDQNSVLDSSLYSDLDDDIGDEEQQQDQREQQAAEKEDAAGPPTPPPAPMKRHVTFSNLKTIVEADKEDEEKEAAAEVSPAKNNNNSNTTGNNSDAEEWMDAVDDDGWWPEEEKKEQAVPLMTDKEWLPLSWTSQGWEPEEKQAKAGHKKEYAAHTKDNKTSTSCWLPPTTSAAGPVKNLQLHRNAAFQGPKPKPRCIRLRSRSRVPVNRRRIVMNNAKEER